MELKHVAGIGKFGIPNEPQFGDYAGRTLRASLSYGEKNTPQVKDLANDKLLEGPVAEYVARALQELSGA